MILSILVEVGIMEEGVIILMIKGLFIVIRNTRGEYVFVWNFFECV